MIKYFSMILVGLFLLIQLIPFGKDHQNPPIQSEPKWNAPATKQLFARAYNDCHSHETKWPWYSHVAPISWLTQRDVIEGREYFNVSLWGTQKKNKGDEAAEELEKGKMPPWFYLPTHPEARLSPTERTALTKGLLSTFGGD